MADDRTTIFITGKNLTPEQLMVLGKGGAIIKLSADALLSVKLSKKVIDDILEDDTKVIYGVNTGFGELRSEVIPRDKLCELQENLIRSHASGVGEPLSPQKTRMLMAIRINVLARGNSGISVETLERFINAFNASCLSYVPEKGTVGACGDLAPLAHLSLGMMGEGDMWNPDTQQFGKANEVLESHGLKAIELGPKEGLSLINGAQLITAIGILALEKAKAIARQADVVAAITLDVFKGTDAAFDADIHAARPHTGQVKVARRFRSLIHSEVFPSEIFEHYESHKKVQDNYSLRCIPQVHGIANDTIDFVAGILTTEMNSSTDNPLVFPERHEILSGGNFHGEYPAKALDYLAIGIHEIANMSERRINRMCNRSKYEIPAFLVKDSGLNSGFMIAHCTAAALVSENKVLTHPSSVDSISTSAGSEDHVSMGGFSARKALTVVEHVEQVIAIELLAACQGLEFLKPYKTTKPLQAVYDLVRTVAKPWVKDRFMAPDINAVTKLLQEEKIWACVEPYIQHYNKTMG
uniref:Histidine ammonia-lyase n=1 Tax=Saccoglossus kowalevskii TaxID=10224 RepID=A0ABM0N144_SACKO|nr:PREDICTED: histidine ammonia-lyase-like isoform X1 [Saccoglossus kowalevskii]